MTADFNVILNFNSAKPVITGAEFKAGDKGFTINMDVRELDPTGMTPKIAFYRSNGTSVESSAVTNVGNIFSYTLLGNELAVPGIVVADLKFYDGDDQRISSASFIFTAISDTLDGLGGGTESYSDELEQLSQEFSDTLEEYKDAFGDVGALNPRGAYDSTADYNVLDLVSYNGSSYLCRTACKNKVPTNTTYWQVFASGSGAAGDYDDLTDKPSINSVTLSGNKTTEELGLFSGDYDDLTNKPTLFSGNYNDLTNTPTIPSDFDDLADVDMAGVADGQVPTWDETAGKYKPGTPSGGGGGTNLNLAINPWFTVNQRGVTSVSSTAETMIADCWEITDGTGSSISNHIISLKKDSGKTMASLRQYFEDSLSNVLNGETVTFSAVIDGTLYKWTFTYSSSTEANQSFEGGTIILMHERNNHPSPTVLNCMTIRITDSNTHVIKCAKLEKGSDSTLLQDAPPDYSTELLKCHRFLRVFASGNSQAPLGLAQIKGTDEARMVLPIEIPFRTVPTLSTIGTFAIIQSDGTEPTATNVLFNGTTDTIGITFKGTSLRQGECARIFLNANAKLILSAEL